MAGLKQTQAAHKIVMEISLLSMEKSWNNHGIWILNFCGNPVITKNDFHVGLMIKKNTYSFISSCIVKKMLALCCMIAGWIHNGDRSC